MGLGTGARSDAIIHAEGVVWREWMRQAISSTPKACGLVSVIRAEGAYGADAEGRGLPRDAFEFLTEILEVIRADAQTEHFLDHRQEISQRTNRAQR
jgi:hypothetical protein